MVKEMITPEDAENLDLNDAQPESSCSGTKVFPKAKGIFARE